MTPQSLPAPTTRDTLPANEHAHPTVALGSNQIVGEQRQTTEPPSSGLQTLKNIASFIKDAKEVIGAITALLAAIVFAFNYFATTKELQCVKAEATYKDERIQNLLLVATLQSQWPPLHAQHGERQEKLLAAITAADKEAARLRLADATLALNDLDDRLKKAYSRRDELGRVPFKCQ